MILNDFFYSFNLFFLIFMRITGLFIAAPFFGTPTFPRKIMIVFAFVTAIVIFPSVKIISPAYDFSDIWNLAGYSMVELAVGATIGFFVNLFITAFQLAARFFSVQMGFGIVNVMDPQSQTSIPIIGQVFGFYVLMVFLLINGHHLLIRAVVRSFEMVNVITLRGFIFSSEVMFNLFSEILVIAFLIGVPVLGTVFLITVTLGILAKVAPQMNIMMLGFPLKIGVGLLIVTMLIPFLYDVVGVISSNLFDKLFYVLRQWGQA